MKKLFFIILFTSGCIAFGQEKYALIIGNSNYTNFGSLKNPVNDANDMEDTLRGLGFTVDKILDGSLSQMENATIRLKNRLNEAGNNSIGFFFYAGHGLEMGGINYLIPADANIPDRNFLRERAFSVQIMLDMLNDSRNALNIVVLDACRDFPASWSRSLNRGLAVISNPPANHIIMYATGAGTVANDGTGRNGLFTSHLLNNLKQNNMDINETFRKTMGDVSRASNNQQRPALYTDFSETVYLNQGLQFTDTFQPKSKPDELLTVEVKPQPLPYQPENNHSNIVHNWFSVILNIGLSGTNIEDQHREKYYNMLPVGFGLGYERMINSKISIGLKTIYSIGLFEDGNAFGIDGLVQFYPWGKKFFTGLGLGYRYKKFTVSTHHFSSSIEPDVLISEYANENSLVLTPEIGWKFVFGKPGGLYLQPGMACSFNFGTYFSSLEGSDVSKVTDDMRIFDRKNFSYLGSSQIIYLNIGYAF